MGDLLAFVLHQLYRPWEKVCLADCTADKQLDKHPGGQRLFRLDEIWSCPFSAPPLLFASLVNNWNVWGKGHGVLEGIVLGLPVLNKQVGWASLVAQTVKCLSAMQETRVQSLGWEDPLEKETAAHFSILARKIPWTAEPGRLPSMGLQRVRHD